MSFEEEIQKAKDAIATAGTQYVTGFIQNTVQNIGGQSTQAQPIPAQTSTANAAALAAANKKGLIFLGGALIVGLLLFKKFGSRGRV